MDGFDLYAISPIFQIAIISLVLLNESTLLAVHSDPTCYMDKAKVTAIVLRDF